ncbi:MAG: N-acetyltransferase [Clostridia bacterium]|nr:N-acetyltransferase [Clostridia bacterium]
MVEIKEVKTKRELKKFAKYPVELYKDCPYYVPSLYGDELATFNPKKNFSLRGNECKGFLCYKDGKLVGRIAGLINRKDNELTGKKYVRFSRLDCIDDKEVFDALIGAVEKFGKEYGMDTIHGPWGFNDTDREGMLTYGFDKRSTYATNYYYPYFAERMKEMGFNDESKWIEKRFTIPDMPYERIIAISERLKNKLNVFEVLDKMSIKKVVKIYGKEFFETMNDAYSALDGYVPIVGEAQKNVLKQFATIINPRYSSILIDKDGKVAAFGIVLPSIADALIKSRGRLFPTGFIGVLKSIKKPKELEMALIGVKSEYKNTGINSIIISRIMKNVIDDKIESIESNVMLEHNYNIQNQWKFADSEIIKRRQTYVKEIKI